MYINGSALMLFNAVMEMIFLMFLILMCVNVKNITFHLQIFMSPKIKDYQLCKDRIDVQLHQIKRPLSVYLHVHLQCTDPLI